MKRLLDNLLNNVVIHNPSGTHILAELRQENGKILLVIADSGGGIPPSLRNTLFDPFTTSNSSRNHSKGSGLGLSIVRKIAERHGGSIQLLDAAGE